MSLLLLLLLGRITSSDRRPIAAHRVAWSVCLSVVMFVTRVPCKTAEPIEIPLAVVTQVSPRYHVLDEGPDPASCAKRLNRSRCRLGQNSHGP